MPSRAQHPCSRCSTLTSNRGYCDTCTAARRIEREGYRPAYSTLYKTPRWRQESKKYLAVHPRCSCRKPATVVDHTTPHRGDERLFWDQRNWQAMCKPCHDRKTARGL